MPETSLSLFLAPQQKINSPGISVQKATERVNKQAHFFFPISWTLGKMTESGERGQARQETTKWTELVGATTVGPSVLELGLQTQVGSLPRSEFR